MVLLMSAPSWKQPTYPTVVEEMRTPRYTDAVKQHTVVKMNALPPSTPRGSAWTCLRSSPPGKGARHKRNIQQDFTHVKFKNR